jgi:hypothetical protein
MPKCCLSCTWRMDAAHRCRCRVAKQRAVRPLRSGYCKDCKDAITWRYGRRLRCALCAQEKNRADRSKWRKQRATGASSC